MWLTSLFRPRPSVLSRRGRLEDLYPLTALVLILGLLGLGADLPRAAAQDEQKEPPKLPEGLSEVTKEHLLSKVPNFFSFEYAGSQTPGKRVWLRVDDQHFIERYPDGFESRFKIFGRATVQGQSGTVVVKIEGDPKRTSTPNDSSFKVFIPDKGNKEMVILIRHVDAPWRPITRDKGKTIIVIEKVE